MILAEIKNLGRRPGTGSDQEPTRTGDRKPLPGHLPLLVTPYMTEAMAEECRRIVLPFANTAGALESLLVIAALSSFPPP